MYSVKVELGTTGTSPGAAVEPSTVATSTLPDVLACIATQVRGIERIWLLPKYKRSGADRDKVFIGLADHDIARDRKVVEFMCQLDSVDYDLVPRSAFGMVPDGAVEIRTQCVDR